METNQALQHDIDKHQKPHVVIVPSPGMGHLIPLAEFAKLLVSRFNFSVSLLPPTTTDQPTEAQSSFLGSLPSSISYTFLDPVDVAHLPENVTHEITVSFVHAHSLSSIRAHLGLMAQRARAVALVVDLFGTGLFDVARELGIPPYMYFTSTAMFLLFSFHLPKLDETVSCEYRDMPNALVLPGCVPLHGKDFEDAVQDRSDEVYQLNHHHVKRYGLAEGIFVNTFMGLEPGAIRALQTEDPDRPPIYPIGPILRSETGDDADGSECLRWLDQQPTGSVLFVSFGSGGTLSNDQLNELAIGLERSGQRFLWVVKSPNDESSFGSFFTAQSQEDPFNFLPKGYLHRTKDFGLLVSSWAPQIEILGHGSTGGFLTHCGWNSILESIIHGVPLIAWPLYTEQKTNAVMLEQGLKVALRPKPNEHGLVEANEIAKVVRDLMKGEEGKRVRGRIKNLSIEAKKSINENGDSTELLQEVAQGWKMSQFK